MIEIIISIALVIFTAVALGMLANIYFDSERKDRIEAGGGCIIYISNINSMYGVMLRCKSKILRTERILYN